MYPRLNEDPHTRLLAIFGQDPIPDGVYEVELDSVMMLPDGHAVERYRIVECPGHVYEEVHDASSHD